MLRLAGLFALDSFGGGFVVQSFAAYWFYLRFGVDPKTLGTLFFAANVFAGLSALAASRLANRIGLVNTMVVTHLPSNVLLMLIPVMPTLPLATLVLLLRFSISQMDVPTRQSYTMAVVAPEERAAASGVTGVARTTGAALSPLFAGLLFSHPSLINVPFYIAGALKIVYDLLLYRAFRSVKPPEEISVPNVIEDQDRTASRCQRADARRDRVGSTLSRIRNSRWSFARYAFMRRATASVSESPRSPSFSALV